MQLYKALPVHYECDSVVHLSTCACLCVVVWWWWVNISECMLVCVHVNHVRICTVWSCGIMYVCTCSQTQHCGCASKRLDYCISAMLQQNEYPQCWVVNPIKVPWQLYVCICVCHLQGFALEGSLGESEVHSACSVGEFNLFMCHQGSDTWEIVQLNCIPWIPQSSLLTQRYHPIYCMGLV